MDIIKRLEKIISIFFDWIYRKRLFVLSTISLLLLLPYIYACFFIHPFGDDLVFSRKISDQGRIDFIINFFKNWSGRYMANSLLAIPKANLEESLFMYRLVPLVFIGLLFFSIFSLIKEFIKNTFSVSKILLFVFFVLAIFITNMPEPFSALYWYCSSFYLPALCFYLFFLKYLIRYYLNEDKSIKTVFMLFLFSFFVCGLIEIFIFFNLIIFGFIILKGWLSEIRKTDWVALSLSIFTLLLLVFILKFSGTDNRVDVSSSEYGLGQTAIRSLYEVFLLHYSKVLLSPLGVLLLIIAILSFQSNLIESKAFKKIADGSPMLIFTIGFLIFYCAHALSLYGAGYTLQGRVLNISQFLFCIYIYLFLISVFSRVQLGISASFKKILSYSILLIFSLSLFSKSNMILISEAKYILPEFDRQLTERYAIIKKAMEENRIKVIINPITINPRSFYLGEFDKNINFYNSEKVLRDLSFYYGIEVKLSRKADKLKY